MAFSGWDYYIDVTIDSAQVDADLTDFPVYINLADLPSDFFTNVKSDGGDIRTTNSDGSTEFPREVVWIDTGAETGELHVKVTGTLSSSSDTVVRIYYGNVGASEPAAGATYGSQNVWGSQYKAVYHLQGDPTAGNIIDSTANGLNMNNNGLVSGDSVDAKIGKGIDFDTNDYLRVNKAGGTGAIAAGNDTTVQCWVNSTAPGGEQYIISEASNSTSGSSRAFWGLNAQSNGRVRFFLRDNSQSILYNLFSARTDVFNGTDRMLHLTIDDANDIAEIFVNGVADGTDDESGMVSMSSLTKMTIGGFFITTFLSGYQGLVDEVRFQTTRLSDEWISTEYNNQNSSSTFYSVGSQESNTPGGGGSADIFFGFVC